MLKNIALLTSTIFTLNLALPSLSQANLSSAAVDTKISQVSALDESFFNAFEAVLVDYTYSKNSIQDVEKLNQRIIKLYQNDKIKNQIQDIISNNSNIKLSQPKLQKTVLQGYLDDYKLLRIEQMKSLTEKLKTNYDSTTEEMKLAFKNMGLFLSQIKKSLDIDSFEKKSQEEQYQTKLVVSQIALTVAGIITAIAVFSLITPAIIFAIYYGPVIILMDIAAISATWYYSSKVNTPLADVANSLNSAVTEIKNNSLKSPSK